MSALHVCSCGRAFSLEAWFALPLCGPYDDGVEILELRNCTCGSTRAIVSAVHVGARDEHQQGRSEEKTMARPEDFTEFRVRFAALLTLAGLHDAARLVGDDGLLAGKAVQVAWDAWRDLETWEDEQTFADALPVVLHDAVLDLGGSLEQARLVEQLAERSS